MRKWRRGREFKEYVITNLSDSYLLNELYYTLEDFAPPGVEYDDPSEDLEERVTLTEAGQRKLHPKILQIPD